MSRSGFLSLRRGMRYHCRKIKTNLHPLVSLSYREKDFPVSHTDTRRRRALIRLARKWPIDLLPPDIMLGVSPFTT